MPVPQIVSSQFTTTTVSGGSASISLSGPQTGDTVVVFMYHAGFSMPPNGPFEVFEGGVWKDPTFELSDETTDRMMAIHCFQLTAASISFAYKIKNHSFPRGVQHAAFLIRGAMGYENPTITYGPGLGWSDDATRQSTGTIPAVTTNAHDRLVLQVATINDIDNSSSQPFITLSGWANSTLDNFTALGTVSDPTSGNAYVVSTLGAVSGSLEEAGSSGTTTVSSGGRSGHWLYGGIALVPRPLTPHVVAGHSISSSRGYSIWNADTKSKVNSDWPVLNQRVRGVSWSEANDKLALVTDTSPYLHVFNTVTRLAETGWPSLTTVARGVDWSPDGQWLAVKTDEGATGTRVVMGGENGSARSLDGVSWATAGLTATSARGVEWFEHLQQWWAYGYAGYIGSSTTGQSWTSRSGDCDLNDNIQRIVYVPTRNKYVATIEGNWAYTSTNLLNWTVTTAISGTAQGRAVVYSPELDRTIIGQSDGGNGRIKWSDDLVTWTEVNTGITQFPMNNAIWCPAPVSRFIVVADDGQVAYSPTGLAGTWTSTTLTDFGTNGIWGLAYSPSLNRVLAFSYQSGQMAYSDNGGTSWTYAGTISNLSGVTWGAVWADPLDMFIVGDSNDGSIHTSPDGLNWTMRSSPVSVGLNALSFRSSAIPGEGTLTVINTATKQIDSTWPIIPGLVGDGGAIEFSHSGDRLAVAAYPSPTLHVIDVATKTVEAGWPTLTGGTGGGLSWSPLDDRIAVGHSGLPRLSIVNTSSKTVESGWTLPIANIVGAHFSPNGRYLAVVSSNGAGLMMYNVLTKALIPSWNAILGGVTILAVRFSPDSQTLAVGMNSSGPMTYFFDVPSGTQQSWSSGTNGNEAIEWMDLTEDLAWNVNEATATLGGSTGTMATDTTARLYRAKPRPRR